MATAGITRVGTWRTEFTESSRIHPDFIFCGVHTSEQLAKRYASADVFLFPSETETFGNVTLEAMASGLVVVAYILPMLETVYYVLGAYFEQ